MSDIIINGVLVLAALAIIGVVICHIEHWLSSLDSEEENEEEDDILNYWMFKSPEEEYY